jgi:hypothetical protein
LKSALAEDDANTDNRIISTPVSQAAPVLPGPSRMLSARALTYFVVRFLRSVHPWLMLAGFFRAQNELRTPLRNL